jgi:2-aminobenzoate-CoA ligase
MLGPSGHVDSFTRDRLPAAEDWPVIDTGGFRLSRLAERRRSN